MFRIKLTTASFFFFNVLCFLWRSQIMCLERTPHCLEFADDIHVVVLSMFLHVVFPGHRLERSGSVVTLCFLPCFACFLGGMVCLFLSGRPLLAASPFV